MDIFDISAKITLDSSGFEQGVSSASGAMDGLSAKAVAVGNALYDIGKKAVSAFGEISKAALEGYANFEQLSGGIDTLFGSASDAVMKNAEQAFKTAGMSANEYMETAIGFSAALINSVGGDTERAADLADRAITDMSDNANKMGTTLESLQNAYRGFSRGNFTMLDNLALGFSGTKEGMQELLDKAEELSGVEFDISSYADIVEAIHVVQTEMGITGTTAAEAAGTISGSVQTMKSAWKNWLAGLGNADADMSGLTDNLVQSFKTVGDNVLPVLDQIRTNLGKVFTDLTGIDVAPILEKFGEIKSGISDTLGSLFNDFQIGGPEAVFSSIFSSLSSGFEQLQTALPGIMESVKTTLGNVFSSIGESLSNIFAQIVQNLPGLISNVSSALSSGRSALIEGATALFGAIIEALPQVATTISENLPQLVEQWAGALTQNVSMIVDAGMQLFSALAEALPEVIPTLVEIIPGLIEQIGTAIVENAQIILEAGIELFAALLGSIPDIITNLAPLLSEMITEIVGVLLELSVMLVEVGVQLFSVLPDDLPAILEALFKVLPELIVGIITELLTYIPEFVSAGIDLLSAIVGDIPGILAAIVVGIIDLISGIVEEIISHKDDIIQAGMDLLAGLGEGFSAAVTSVTEKAKAAVNKVVDKVKEVLGIASPSKVFKGLGLFTMEGLAIGIENGADKYSKRINKAITGMVPSNMTASVDFASSSLGKSSAAQINTMLAGMEERGGNYNINLVVDGRTLANVVFDPLNAVSKQKGVAIGA
jgi:phage-related protein